MRVVSGIQPTGRLHLGNYLGAVRPWVTLSSRARVVASPSPAPSSEPSHIFISIADLHAMTVPHDPSLLRASTHDMASSLLACGLEPDGKRVGLFVQSSVREHTELSWLCACATPLGALQRMTQFKSKSNSARASAALGLLSYPVLQAADILLYRATHVPVGEDQHQHLELAREIAAIMNARLGGAPILIPPATLSLSVGSRIMSLRDASKKMSKSDASDDSRINMDDADDVILRKVRAAKTDSAPGFDSINRISRPEKANLVAILAAVTGETPEAVSARHAASAATVFKAELADALVGMISPIRRRLEQLRADRGAVEEALQIGAEYAREEASATMKQVRSLSGYQ